LQQGNRRPRSCDFEIYTNPRLSKAAPQKMPTIRKQAQSRHADSPKQPLLAGTRNISFFSNILRRKLRKHIVEVFGEAAR